MIIIALQFGIILKYYIQEWKRLIFFSENNSIAIWYNIKYYIQESKRLIFQW